MKKKITKATWVWDDEILKMDWDLPELGPLDFDFDLSDLFPDKEIECPECGEKIIIKGGV